MQRHGFKSISKKAGLPKVMLPALLLSLIAALLLAGGIYAGNSYAAEDEVYLSDLKPLSASTGWGNPCNDEGLDGNPIKIVSKTYSKGICIHAASELVYDISAGEYTVFSADIGIHDGTNNTTKSSSSVKFVVKTEKETLYESGVFKINTPAEHIEVQIPQNASKLYLITTDAGDGINGDHSAWADAKFTVGTADPTQLKDVTVSLGSSDVPVGSSTQISLVMSDRGGNTVSPADAKITYTSLDPAGASVDANGKVTVLAPGSTVIRVDVSYKDSSRSEKVTVRGTGAAADGFTASLASPGGQNSLAFSLDAYGCLLYTLKDGSETMLAESTVGVRTSVCDFSDGLRYVSHSFSEIREEYSNISGKHSTVKNEANLMTAVFEKGSYRFTVEFKLYDDGFAYRYTIDPKNGTGNELVIEKETGYFTLPESSKLFAITVGSLSNSFNHEAGYDEFSIGSCKGKYIAFPALVSIGDRFLLLSEAELYGDSYIGSMLCGIGDNRLQMHFAPKTASDVTVTTSASFTSPWRCGITGSLGDVVESDLIENVCDRTTEDFSFVKPGVTAWMWLSQGYGGQSDYKTIKQYIDLASEMGWSYLVLDEGWQPHSSEEGKTYGGYYAWFDEMLAYAEEKNVGILVWVLCNDLNTPAKREILKEWSDKGIKGIKVDFFDSEDQDHISYYKAIYEECAKQKLIVNVHGANKPTGERQWWPNIINREAVNGEEYGGYGAHDLNVWAYTRNVVGPMDLTPRLNPTASSETTVGAQIAMNVLFESGIPCMASAVNEYQISPARSFYLDLPAAWDDIHFIDGYPGKYTVLARRSGENWYVAGSSNGGRDVTVKYDFLDDGDYMAFIYRDGEGKYDLITEQLLVNKKDEFTVHLKTGSGFAVKLIKVTDETKISNLAASKTELSLTTEESVQIELTGTGLGDGRYLVWKSSDEKVASVDACGKVTALRAGSAEITAAYLGDPSVSVKVKLTVTAGSVRRASAWKVKNPSPVYSAQLDSENPSLLHMQTIAGDIGGSFSNVWYFDAPEGDFEATVTVKARLQDEPQTAGLVIFDDSGKAAAAARRVYEGANCLSFYSYTSSYSHETVKDSKTSTAVQLKLVREGDSVKAFYSYNGKEWISFAKTVNIKTFASSGSLKIGIYCGCGGRGFVRNVQFSNFTLNGVRIPFAVPGDAPTVTAVDAVGEIKTSVGTAIDGLALPKTVSVSYSDGSKAELPVVWSSTDYNKDTAGSYSFIGQICAADGGAVDNPEALTAKLTVVSEAALPSDADNTPADAPSEPPAEANPGKSSSYGYLIAAGVVILIAAGVITAVVLGKKKTGKAKKDDKHGKKSA